MKRKPDTRSMAAMPSSIRARSVSLQPREGYPPKRPPGSSTVEEMKVKPTSGCAEVTPHRSPSTNPSIQGLPEKGTAIAC